MTEAGKAIRAVGHPTVATLAKKYGYDAIAERNDLTPGEQFGAMVGTAIVQFIAHVAVEAVADWADQE